MFFLACFAFNEATRSISITGNASFGHVLMSSLLFFASKSYR
jgi:hypothetical protein